jgi:hypothetical protein
VALALALPATASAELYSAYDLPGGSLTASFGKTGNPPPLTLEEGRYGIPTGAIPVGGAWSVAFTVTPPSGDTDLLEVGHSTLSLRDGVLEWSHRGGTQGGGAPVPAGIATQIVLSRDDGVVRVFRDKALVHEVLESGTHLDGLRVTGHASRVRLFTHALGTEEALALRPADGQAPGAVSWGPGHGLYQDGSTLWAGPRGFFALEASDDGTGPLAFQVGVYARSAIVASPAGPIDRGAYPVGNEEIVSGASVPFDLRALEHGEEYRVSGAVTDRAGNRTEFERPIRVDLRAPQGLTLDVPDETTDRSPVVGGAAIAGLRDNLSVAVMVCRGATCDADPEDEVAFGGGAIEDGRWSVPELHRWAGDRPEPVPVTSLPLGTYTIRAIQSDYVDNVATVDRVVRIVAPPRGEGPVVPSPPRTTPPVAETRPAPPPPPSLCALLARARAAVSAALLRERLRGWLRDGRVDVPVAVDQAAEVVVQVFDGAAPAKVDPRTRAAAAKAGRLLATGRRAFAAPGSGRVTVRLSRRGRTLLKGRRSRRVSVRTIVTPRGGKAVAATHRLTLRR